MNPEFELIEDAVISALECDTGVWLPSSFEVRVPDDFFAAMLKSGLINTQSKKPILDVKRVTFTISGFSVTVRSDADPDDWAPMPREEALH